MKFSCFPIVVLLVSASPLCAADDWIKVSTENIEVFTAGGEGVAKRTALHFEQIRGFFLQTMGIESKSEERVRIIGFRNDREMDPFRPTEFASAYYTELAGRDIIVLGRIGAERHETAVHEYMHLLVRSTGVELPPWLNEGFAELYSTLEPRGKKVMVGALPMGRLAALQQLKWIPMERLLQVRHGDPEYNLKAHAGAFYAESWALTHMLKLNADYRAGFADFLDALVLTGDGAKAFQQVYSRTPEEVELQLRSYVKQGSFMVELYDIKLEKSAEAPEVSAASELEIGLILAGLMGGQREKREEAEARLEELAELHPDSPEVAEAQGYLAWQGGSAVGAVEHFARAAELGATNPKMYRDLAALARGERGLEFQIAMMQKAVDLEPENLDTRRILGHLFLQNEQWARAAVELNKVTKVETEEQAFALQHARAYAYYRLNSHDEAEKLARQARKFSDGPQKTAQVELLLEAIARVKDRDNGGSHNEVALAQPGMFGGLVDESGPPNMRRNVLPPGGKDVDVELKPEQPSFTGRLVQFDCLGDSARLHVESAAGPRTFALLDPMNVVIKRNGEPAADVSFTCGPQDGRAITIAYVEPEEDGEANAVALDFLDALP